MSAKFKKGTVYIGSDEVGKGEPLRRLAVVSAYVDEAKMDKLHALGADKDSKKFSNIDAPGVHTAGMELTEFKTFADCKDGVYKNEEYGIVYAVCSLSNKEFNAMHSLGKNQNKILSEAHNRVNMMLYKALQEDGIYPEYIVIDNYMGQYSNKFDEYMADCKEEQIKRDTEAKVCFEAKAESDYPAVACASVIGSYIEYLWQEEVRQQLKQAGGNPELLTFGNTNSGIDVEFAELERVYGSLDASEADIKHTSHYDRYRKK